MYKMDTAGFMARAPTTPEGAPEQSVDVIGNIEALLRDDDEDEDFSFSRPAPTVANNQHFFVVSAPTTPLNPKLSALNSTMNCGAVPFQPRLQSQTQSASQGLPTTVASSSEGLFSPALLAAGPVPTFTPYAPIHVSMGPPQPRTSTLRDAVRPGFIALDSLKSYTERHYAIIVNNLDPRTQSKHLMTIFFPLGAVDALAFQSPVGTEEMGTQFAGRKGGIVMFASAEMASMASGKIDDFVPHGQTLPLHTSYFGRFADYEAVRETFTMNRPSAATCGSGAADAGVVGPPTPTPPYVAANTSINASANGSPTAAEAADRLAAVFVRAAETSAEEADKALDSLLTRFASDPIRRAPIVIAVLTAVQQQQERLPFGPHFLRSLSRFAIQRGLMDHTTPRDLKLACAVVCGTMFALNIVRGNPFGMALRIVNELIVLGGGDGDASVAAAAAAEPLPLLSEGQANTVEALVTLGRSWRSRAPAEATAERAEVEELFEAALQRLVDDGRLSEAVAAAASDPFAPTTASTLCSDPSTPTTPNAPSTPLPSGVVANGNGADATANAPSNATAASCGSFVVSATPVRHAPPSAATSSAATPIVVTTHHALNLSASVGGGGGGHNISVESCVSSVGPRYSSTMQTPEKRTVTMMDTSALSNTSGASYTTHHGHHHGLHHSLQQAPSSTAGGAMGGPTGAGAPPFSLSLLGALEGSNLRQHLMAATVYMTKVPLTLPHSTLRRLFECFGEFNKVRIYEEKKPSGGAAMSVGGQVTQTIPKVPQASGPTAFNSRGNFGFVEFVIPASSKAMVDFFRNPSPSVQQRMGISRVEMEAILTMRVSYARSCIHDHDPDDALFDCSDVMPNDADSPGRKVKACTFGMDP